MGRGGGGGGKGGGGGGGGAEVRMANDTEYGLSLLHLVHRPEPVYRRPAVSSSASSM